MRYSETVRRNVELGDAGADHADDEIHAGIDAAGAGASSTACPTASTPCSAAGSPAAPSCRGGEWQRISLARAVLRDARILLLDEPTSAMDSWAETDWVNRFRDLAHGRTAVIISHRLTTAMKADVIHVMERGRIVESGSHRELLTAAAATPRRGGRRWTRIRHQRRRKASRMLAATIRHHPPL